MRGNGRVGHPTREMGLSWTRLALAAVVAAALLVGCTTGASTNTSGVGAASAASSQSTTGAVSSQSRVATTAPPAKSSGRATPPKKSSHATSRVRGPQPFDRSQLDPRVTQATIRTTIAVTGYTTRVRPPESVTEPIKLSLMRQHHYTDSPADYELDHFIPLEAGGSSNLSNLWLEPIAEARRKDKDENLTRREVVSGVWTLAQGQQYIRAHWHIHYRS
jgi:hypothetical protein